MRNSAPQPGRSVQQSPHVCTNGFSLGPRFSLTRQSSVRKMADVSALSPSCPHLSVCGCEWLCDGWCPVQGGPLLCSELLGVTLTLVPLNWDQKVGK